ncbi:glycosyltransferase family 1 protein [Calidifontibacter sp. DB0510]|uniref:D-inositol 3-phosphate glycosyltransferase n=1 Tax=Metallococcus carri TaxID=1656884 RepID=A0A967B0I5_9MICO|nr:glycosyltransferase family 1 protein [Metallococcus carri]NOP38855.1 glycosyltransferase family 1 protein [Calidifontibacter sp. DB2511S]
MKIVRIAIVSESFLPSLNGVTTSVCRVLDRLADLGHEALVVCPGPAPETYRGFRVHTVRGVTLRQFRVGLPSWEIESALRAFRPDVVHAASPFGLGARGLAAARNLGIPTVAIYQTDMPSYLGQHAGPLRGRIESTSWRWIRHLHSLADITLAPSSATMDELAAHGIPRVALWSRGVDTELYDPARRSDPDVEALRACVAPNGETIIGYVGRLAPEKEVHRLQEVHDLPGTCLVIVGDGPTRDRLERLLPKAHFLGYRSGVPLAQAYAALDVFMHTGTRETFGQTLQEAMAAGLPVVAPAMGGPLDIVKPGVTGLLFDPAHPGALRQAVGGLVNDEAMRTRMGVSARGKVEQRGWARMVDQLLEFYADVVTPAHLRRVA